MLLQLISENTSVTYDELSEATGLTRKTIQRNIQTLKNSGLIKRIGSDKTGYWEVPEE